MPNLKLFSDFFCPKGQSRLRKVSPSRGAVDVRGQLVHLVEMLENLRVRITERDIGLDELIAGALLAPVYGPVVEDHPAFEAGSGSLGALFTTESLGPLASLGHEAALGLDHLLPRVNGGLCTALDEFLLNLRRKGHSREQELVLGLEVGAVIVDAGLDDDEPDSDGLQLVEKGADVRHAAPESGQL